jgi:hypothetical protein
MHGMPRAILLFLLGLVLLSPIIDLFDDNPNIEQDRDVVLLLLAAPIGLFVLTKNIVDFFPGLFSIAALPGGVSRTSHDFAAEVELSPSGSLALLGSFRI